MKSGIADEVGGQRGQLFERLDDRHDQPAAVSEEPEHGDAAEQREDRRSQCAGDEHGDEPRQQRAAFKELIVIRGEVSRARIPTTRPHVRSRSRTRRAEVATRSA